MDSTGSKQGPVASHLDTVMSLLNSIGGRQ